MDKNFNELFGRLEICKNEIREFSKQVEDFTNSAFEVHWVETAAEFEVHGHVVKEVPLQLRSRSGMIINELRTILDALAFILAQKNGKSRSREVL